MAKEQHDLLHQRLCLLDARRALVDQIHQLQDNHVIYLVV